MNSKPIIQCAAEGAVYSRGKPEQSMRVDKLTQALMLDNEAEAQELCALYGLSLQPGGAAVIFDKARAFFVAPKLSIVLRLRFEDCAIVRNINSHVSQCDS